MASPQQLLIAAAPPAGGQSVWIFSDNTTGDYAGVDGGIDDVFLDMYNPTVNQSSGGNAAQLNTREGEGNTLIRAPGISSIPSSRVAVTVTIGVYRLDGAGGTPEVKLARLADGRAWVESEATWNIYRTGDNWGTAGCTNVLTDIPGGGGASGTDNAAGQNAWSHISTAGLVTDVNNIISATNENNGWRLVTAGVYGEFRSSRGTDGTRPYIRIETDPA